MKAQQVQESVRSHGEYRADQSAIWADISERASRRDAASPSMAVKEEFVRWLHSPENNRAPGHTCLQGVANMESGVHWSKSGIAGSKGCGSAMRAAPIGYAIMIGRPFDKYSSDLTWRSPDEVKDIAEALANLSEKDLLKRRNPPKASKIRIYDYPAGFKKKDIEEVLPYFRKLRDYYSAAAKQGNALLVHVG